MPDHPPTADVVNPCARTDAEVGGHWVRSMWTSGWQRYLFPGLWLVYLAQTINGVQRHTDGAASIVGYALTVAFGVCYVVALPVGQQHRLRAYWTVYGLCIALTVATAFFAQSDAFVFLVYISVLTVAARRRWAGPAVVCFALVGTFVPHLIPAWHEGVIWSLGLVILLVSVAMWGFFHIIDANRELAAARAEVARLAAENERSRIARDLHDLLGHSLTTITVKAGLARRLAERGAHDQSRQEITEVEQLTRRTLGDVRAAVAGHRDVTLAGELATAREVLRAAGIVAELPGSVDVVDPMLSETFGWVVREGVTNIVRHSRAELCRVTFGPRWIEIADTGRGGVTNGSGADGSGSGLAGLGERLTAVGGTVRAGSGLPGFVLRAEVPEPQLPPAGTGNGGTAGLRAHDVEATR